MKTWMKIYFKKNIQESNIIQTEVFRELRIAGFLNKNSNKSIFHNQNFSVFLAKAENELNTNATEVTFFSPDSDVTQGGIAVFLKNGLRTKLNYRFLENETEIENKPIIREKKFLTDLVIIVPVKKWELSIKAENLFNKNWEKTESDPLSWFNMEKNIIQKFIFSPDTPRFFTASWTINF